METEQGSSQHETLSAVVEGIVNKPLQRVKNELEMTIGKEALNLEDQLSSSLEETMAELSRIRARLVDEESGLAALRTLTETSRAAALDAIGLTSESSLEELRQSTALLSSLVVKGGETTQSVGAAVGQLGDWARREAQEARAQRTEIHRQLQETLAHLESLQATQVEANIENQRQARRQQWLAACAMAGAWVAVLLMVWLVLNPGS